MDSLGGAPHLRESMNSVASDLSSNTRSPSSADIYTKYQRLASEYSKIRSQNQVLKKAVIEEQSKSDKLTEELSVKQRIIDEMKVNAKASDPKVKVSSPPQDTRTVKDMIDKYLKCPSGDSDINKLIESLCMLHSKAAAYHDQSVVLEQRIAVMNKDLDEKSKEASALRDEISLTQQSYESQITILSDHLAELNDKLLAQQLEITSLRESNDSNKGSRGRR